MPLGVIGIFPFDTETIPLLLTSKSPPNCGELSFATLAIPADPEYAIVNAPAESGCDTVISVPPTICVSVGVPVIVSVALPAESSAAATAILPAPFITNLPADSASPRVTSPESPTTCSG